MLRSEYGTREGRGVGGELIYYIFAGPTALWRVRSSATIPDLSYPSFVLSILVSDTVYSIC